MQNKLLQFSRSVFWSLLICMLLTGSANAAMRDSNFINLCKTGSLERITNAIEKGANVNATDRKGLTPLMSAAGRSKPDPEIITALIEASADVNARTTDGTTALMWAASDSNLEVIKILIEASADVSAKNSDGLTPLMFAAEYNSDPEVITTLIEAGANINEQNVDGLTPLMFAAATNSTDIIKILINAGSDFYIENTGKWTPLILAAWKTSNPEAITIFLDLGIDPKAKDIYGKMAMDYAKGNKNLRNTDALKRLEEVSR